MFQSLTTAMYWQAQYTFSLFPTFPINSLLLLVDNNEEIFRPPFNDKKIFSICNDLHELQKPNGSGRQTWLYRESLGLSMLQTDLPSEWVQLMVLVGAWSHHHGVCSVGTRTWWRSLVRCGEISLIMTIMMIKMTLMTQLYLYSITMPGWWF